MQQYNAVTMFRYFNSFTEMMYLGLVISWVFCLASQWVFNILPHNQECCFLNNKYAPKIKCICWYSSIHQYSIDRELLEIDRKCWSLFHTHSQFYKYKDLRYLICGLNEITKLKLKLRALIIKIARRTTGSKGCQFL